MVAVEVTVLRRLLFVPEPVLVADGVVGVLRDFELLLACEDLLLLVIGGLCTS